MTADNELLNALTDEERAALGDEGLGDDLETPAESKAALEATAEAPTAEAEQTLAPEIEREAAQEVAPPLRASTPDNVNEIIAALAQQQEELAAKFDEGDITAKEYREAMDNLATQREEIRWAQRKAELASEMVESAKRENWEKEVSDFMTAGPGATIAKSQTQMVAFDNLVRQVTADPANQSLSDRAQLHKAFRLYKEDFKRAYGFDFEGQAQPTQAQAAQPPARAPRAVVPTLANVPAAEAEVLSNGKFEALDRLASTDPAAYEAAVARMSDSERAAFESIA